MTTYTVQDITSISQLSNQHLTAYRDKLSDSIGEQLSEVAISKGLLKKVNQEIYKRKEK